MEAFPSALPHQVSSAVRILVPRDWMAKSTMVVVPPMAAAFVPDSKSSEEKVPPKGMSRWVWASTPPGRTRRPVASTISWPSGGMPERTSRMVAPSMRTSAGVVDSAVTTVPFWINKGILWASNWDGDDVPHSSKSGLSGPPGLFITGCLDHLDAVIYGADEGAEVAADAGGFVDAGEFCQGDGIAGAGEAFASVLIDALVGPVPAGGVAEAAADAGLWVDAGDDLIVEVEAAPVGDAVEGASAEVFDGSETLALHPLGELVLHAFDDAETVV